MVIDDDDRDRLIAMNRSMMMMMMRCRRLCFVRKRAQMKIIFLSSMMLHSPAINSPPTISFANLRDDRGLFPSLGHWGVLSQKEGVVERARFCDDDDDV